METGYKEKARPSNPSFVQPSEFILFHPLCAKIRQAHPPPRNVFEGEALPCARSHDQPTCHLYNVLLVQSVTRAHQKLCCGSTVPGKALSLNILLMKNKCLWTLANSVCLGICHCITVSLKQSPILQSSGSYGEAGPLKGSCSSQSNLLRGRGESYIIPSPLFSIL